ncbi:hypothetical protein PISMIDRAFT_18275 [Pisolithus microcarpus 441]|uniref:Myb/SANT-like domain-containing protein n=1 Tax=Pisolithus microcarpus 441 TaxID=765257 RepID=A0A0C9YYU9_9AGAM|nr:hypothetical protein PISMIDRAFT_18275 [Pisolithus microcarpus 441]
MDYGFNLDHLRLAWVSAASVVALISQHTLDSLVHPMPPKATNPKAQWCEEEVKALVKFLYDHQSEAGDNGNFKSSTYHAAAGHIAPLLKDGPPKTSAAVKNKWTGYDHPLMRQFKTSGWEFYLLVEQIIPNGAAHRIHAFSPGGSGVGGSSLAGEDRLFGADVPATDLPEALASATAVPELILATPEGQIPADLPSTINDLLSMEDAPLPPSSIPPSSHGKCTHVEMLGDDMPALPFTDTNDIFTPVSEKHMNMAAAMDYAKTSQRSHHSCKALATPPPTILDLMAAGLQGSINYLTSKISSSMTLAVDKASIMWAQAIQILDMQDCSFPKKLHAHIQLSIAQNIGFADVYVRTSDQEEQLAYAELECQFKVGFGVSLGK